MNRREFIEEDVGWYLSVVTVGVKDNWRLLQSVGSCFTLSIDVPTGEYAYRRILISLLCTDGLTEMVTADTIAAVLGKAASTRASRLGNPECGLENERGH